MYLIGFTITTVLSTLAVSFLRALVYGSDIYTTLFSSAITIISLLVIGYFFRDSQPTDQISFTEGVLHYKNLVFNGIKNIALFGVYLTIIGPTSLFIRKGRPGRNSNWSRRTESSMNLDQYIRQY